MASKNREGVKRGLLLGFVAVSLVLIVLVWVDGLGPNEPATPSYYRGSFQMDPDVYLTVTAEAVEFEQQLNGTPAPESEEEHQGSGGGQGRGQAHDAATPTLEVTGTP